jgi:hypothetical protein
MSRGAGRRCDRHRYRCGGSRLANLMPRPPSTLRCRTAVPPWISVPIQPGRRLLGVPARKPVGTLSTVENHAVPRNRVPIAAAALIPHTHTMHRTYVWVARRATAPVPRAVGPRAAVRDLAGEIGLRRNGLRRRSCGLRRRPRPGLRLSLWLGLGFQLGLELGWREHR